MAATMTSNRKMPALPAAMDNLHLEVLEHGLYAGDTSWQHRDIQSHYSRLYFMLEGRTRAWNAAQALDMVAGQACLLPLSLSYHVGCDAPFRKFYVHLRVPLGNGQDVFAGLDRFLSLPFDAVRFEGLVEDAIGHPLPGALALKAELYATIGRLMALAGIDDPAALSVGAEVRTIYGFLGQHAGLGLSPGTVASVAGRPLASLARDFRKQTGLTLNQAIRRAIIQRAKDALVKDERSVKEIAFSLGFSDEFYFSRYFRNQTGQSPALWRASHRWG